MEEQKFETLVEQHYQSIYAYCCRHVADRELAQDLTQSTFLRFWQNRERYRHHGKALNYLYTIAGNLCRDWFKRKKPVYLEELPEEPSSPAADRDTALAVRAALAALPFKERDVVLLHYYHGLKAAEIAAVTHSTSPAVRYRLRRAEELLRELLKEELG